MLRSPVDSKTDTFCPIAYFFLFVLSKVLTGFYLPMGATLIQASLEAGFPLVTALDVGAMDYSYVYFYWHGFCNTRTASDFQLCKEVLARSLQGIFFTVMSCFIGTDLA